MSSLSSIIQQSREKDIISETISYILEEITQKDLEELTNSVFEKINYMDNLKVELLKSKGLSLDKIAKEHNLDAEEIVEYTIYFSMILENILLTQRLKQIEG